ncbi:MAG: PilZ domain-containing protein [Proteobacteria bacterium]|nr:PilZ domain-containing protein [Pseudomonadota bacterium]
MQSESGNQDPLPPNVAALLDVPRDELLRQPSRFEPATEGTSAWIWETDHDQRFVYLSPSVIRMTGLTPEQHYGHRLSELAQVSIKTIDGMSWEDHLRSGKSFGPMDFFCVHETRAFVIRTIAYPRTDQHGTYIGHCGIAVRLPSQKPRALIERRLDPRRRMVRAAEIYFTDDAQPIMCVLLDLSTSGARVELPPMTKLPSTFRLVVPSISLNARCDLRWQRDTEAGCAFMR